MVSGLSGLRLGAGYGVGVGQAEPWGSVDTCSHEQFVLLANTQPFRAGPSFTSTETCRNVEFRRLLGVTSALGGWGVVDRASALVRDAFQASTASFVTPVFRQRSDAASFFIEGPLTVLGVRPHSGWRTD